MSFESFTRHCRGTVTSITFTFSLFLLLSLTNFPYQALTMMRPKDRLRVRKAASRHLLVWLRDPQRPPWTERTHVLTHSGLFCLNYPSDRFLHQPDLPENKDDTVRAPPGLFHLWSEGHRQAVLSTATYLLRAWKGREWAP